MFLESKGGAGGGGDDYHVYSPIEHIVGEVIRNGVSETVYGKFFEIPNMNPASPYYGTVDIGMTDVPFKDIMKFEVYAQADSNTSHPCAHGNFYETNSDKFRAIFEVDSKMLFYHGGTTYPNRPFTIRGEIYYTKTTD